MVVSRADWANRNLATFSHLLAPLESKIAEKLEESGSKGAPALLARQVVAVETGALLGFLARRVLGQYELVLPTGDKGDVVAVVGANVLAWSASSSSSRPTFVCGSPSTRPPIGPSSSGFPGSAATS